MREILTPPRQSPTELNQPFLHSKLQNTILSTEIETASLIMVLSKNPLHWDTSLRQSCYLGWQVRVIGALCNLGARSSGDLRSRSSLTTCTCAYTYHTHTSTNKNHTHKQKKKHIPHSLAHTHTTHTCTYTYPTHARLPHRDVQDE